MNLQLLIVISNQFYNVFVILCIVVFDLLCLLMLKLCSYLLLIYIIYLQVYIQILFILFIYVYDTCCKHIKIVYSFCTGHSRMLTAIIPQIFYFIFYFLCDTLNGVQLESYELIKSKQIMLHLPVSIVNMLKYVFHNE